MKKILIAFITMMALATGYKAAAQPGINFNTFYTELSPYGQWITYPEYGQVWIANETGFEPYANNGHWVFTNYGWTWVSDYAWGWAPFHYGRWAYLDFYGWVWVPGYEWAPAWVSWCSYGGYYGWAPLSPGLGININFYNIPVNRWRFVRHHYIGNANVYQHFERPVKNERSFRDVLMIMNTQVNKNITYVAGPEKKEVERLTKQKIITKDVSFTTVPQKNPVTKNQVQLYQPDVKETGGAVPVKPNAVIKKGETEQPLPTKDKGQVQDEQQQVVPVPAVKQPVQPIKKQVAEENAGQVTPKNELPAQPQQQMETEPVKQVDRQQQEEIKRQRILQEQLVRQQQDAEQQRIQQQNELNKQRAEQEQLRRQQQEIKQQRIQQEQIRRQQEQQPRKEQQEQKVTPQPQPKNNPAQPVKPLKKEKG